MMNNYIKNKSSLIFLFLVFIIVTLFFCGCRQEKTKDAATNGYNVKDDFGYTLHFTEKPKRIIGTTGNIEEILVELVTPEHIAAISESNRNKEYSLIAEEAAKVKNTIPDRASIETIVAQHPDLVFMQIKTNQAMADTAKELRNICHAEKCSLYTVDKSSRQCTFINEDGVQEEYLKAFAEEMGRTPFEVAEAWEKDLALSDCLLLHNLDVIRERDPAWFQSLTDHGIRNLILYAVRYNQELVGFIWAANYDVAEMERIKETLELSTFLIATVISNHQLMSQLEYRSVVDALTQVGNRNAMNDRVDRLVSGEDALPETMGIVFADINGLKVVNDKEGHEAGDKLLVRAASLMKIAFEGSEIFRAGGDEFVVISPNCTEENLALRVSQLRGLTDNTSDVSFAIGTEFCTESYDIRVAMNVADGRMYQDKAEYYRTHPEKDQRRNQK